MEPYQIALDVKEPRSRIFLHFLQGCMKPRSIRYLYFSSLLPQNNIGKWNLNPLGNKLMRLRPISLGAQLRSRYRIHLWWYYENKPYFFLYRSYIITNCSNNCSWAFMHGIGENLFNLHWWSAKKVFTSLFLIISSS